MRHDFSLNPESILNHVIGPMMTSGTFFVANELKHVMDLYLTVLSRYRFRAEHQTAAVREPPNRRDWSVHVRVLVRQSERYALRNVHRSVLLRQLLQDAIERGLGSQRTGQLPEPPGQRRGRDAG